MQINVTFHAKKFNLNVTKASECRIQIKWMYFRVNGLEVGVNNHSIFSGYEQQKMQYHELNLRRKFHLPIFKMLRQPSDVTRCYVYVIFKK